jgi:hypothetical protein
MQIVEHSTGKFGFGASRIQVFIPQDKNTAMSKRAFLSNPKRACVAEMEVPGWGGGEPAAV